MDSHQLSIGAEVATALAEGRPIVALESTIISHGLPRPQNLAAAQEFEAIVPRRRRHAGDDRRAGRRPACRAG